MAERDRVTDEVSRRIRERRSLPSPAERRSLRERAGLSAQDLAGALRVTVSTVLRWETGERRPRGRNLIDYLRVLDTLRRHVRGGPVRGRGV
jgi:DNA-binding transcriptional regulator YiaG